MVSSILCVSVAVVPSKKQNYISTGSSMTAKKHTTYLQGCCRWLIILQLSFLLLISNTNRTWLQFVSVPQHYLCNNIRHKTSLSDVKHMIVRLQHRTYYSFNDTVHNSCTYSTDWLDNSKQQIGTNLEESVIIQFKVLSWHLTGKTGKHVLTQNIWCPSHDSNWTQQKPKHYCFSPLAQLDKTKELWVWDGQITWQRNKDGYLPVSV